MVDQASRRSTVAASPERCFEVAIDFEAYPEWAEDIKSATVLSRDASGRAVDVEFRAAAMGRSTTYVLRYFYGDSPLRLAWRLRRGDVTRRLDGEYEFVPVDGDADACEVEYHLAVDLAVALPGFVKRRAEARIVHSALDDFTARAERRT